MPETLPDPPSAIAKAFEQATALHMQGKIADAEPRYRAILAAQPQHFGALHMLGVLRCQQGKYGESVELIETALRGHPNSAEAHYNLGVALASLGRREEALEHHRSALALKPDFTTAHIQAGNVLHLLGRHDEAIACYRSALAIDGTLAVAHNNLGNALRAQRRPAEAVAHYEIALRIQPDLADTHNNLGNALHDLGRHEEAIACYEKALQIRPDHAEAYANLGNVLRALSRHEEAIPWYQRALAARPAYAEAHYNLGNALKSLNRLEAAVASYQRAIALKPELAIAHINLGNALLDLERHDEAIASYRAALALDPDAASAHNNLANALFKSHRFGEAIESYRRALALDPAGGNARAMYASLNRRVCDWSRFAEDEQALRDAVDRKDALILPFSFLTSIDDPAGQLRCAREFVKSLGLEGHPPLWTGTRYAHDKIRIAYLSTDFREHATSFLMAELFERHDRGRFETYAISLGINDRSAMRTRLERSFHRFLDVRGASNQEIAREIRALEIDIAVDLNGFIQGCRPDILAQRPAPIQVNYLGYPGTMGAGFIDYIIADPFVAPTEFRAYYTEQVVHLPDCYQANDTQKLIAERTPSRRECGLPDRGFVFACFNKTYKITPPFFDIWMRLLHAVPDSVLWLFRDNKWAEENLRRAAQARGISAERLIFAPRIALPEHLARHRVADLFLDTLPCNAHTTASDALWAGLPIVTCAGRSFPARVAGSLLHAIGLTELVTTELASYEALALDLARTPERIASLRGRLRDNRMTAPLFNSDRHRRHLEIAYREMVRLWRSGERPRAIAIPAT